MLSVITQGPAWVRIKTNWRTIQRASINSEWRFSRHKRVLTDGQRNELVEGVKATSLGNGIWLLEGKYIDNSDSMKAIETMKITWLQNMRSKSSQQIAA